MHPYFLAGEYSAGPGRTRWGNDRRAREEKNELQASGRAGRAACGAEEPAKPRGSRRLWPRGQIAVPDCYFRLPPFPRIPGDTGARGSVRERDGERDRENEESRDGRSQSWNQSSHAFVCRASPGTDGARGWKGSGAGVGAGGRSRGTGGPESQKNPGDAVDAGAWGSGDTPDDAQPRQRAEAEVAREGGEGEGSTRRGQGHRREA